VLAPCTTLSVEAEGVSEKDCSGPTVKVTATVAVRLPDFPVTVTVVVLVAALALAVKVSVLAAAVLAGLNAAVTPAGRPEMVRLTAALNPFTGTTVIESAPVPPGATATAVAEAFRL